MFAENEEKKFTSVLLQAYRDKNVSAPNSLFVESRYVCISVFIFSR